MKHLIYLLSVIFLFISCEEQNDFIPTVRITPVFTSVDSLFQIYFTDANTGIVVGNHSTFLRTIDGGNTWQQVAVPDTNIRFTSVSFPTPETGYVSGKYALMKTSDGGATWETVNIAKPFDCSSFPSETVGYYLHNDYIYKSTDGGNTWNETGFDYTSGVYTPIRIYFFSEDTGIVSEEYFGNVSKTYNGGNSWTNGIESHTYSGAFTFRRFGNLHYWSAHYSGYDNLMFSTVNNSKNVYAFNTEGFISGNSIYVRSMHTVDGQIFIATGTSVCAISEDGGDSWTEVFDETGNNFTMRDAAVMKQGRFAGIDTHSIYLLTQDN